MMRVSNSMLLILHLLYLTAAAFPAPASPTQFEREIVVGSKTFTENVLLGEAVTQYLETQGVPARHRRELGGTRFLWNALLSGDIDIYPEYTGTILQEILSGQEVAPSRLEQTLEGLGIGITEPLGFNNTYALGMTEARAEALDIRKISDLVAHPDLDFGFSNEFMDRADGWPALRIRYGLPQRNVRGLDHDLAYRAVAGGTIDVIDLYTTDAEIAYHNLRVIEDDLDHFTEYNAVFLYRLDLRRRAPETIQVVQAFEGQIEASEMIALNRRAKIEGVSTSRVAAGFLEEEFGVTPEVETIGLWTRVGRRTLEHLYLVLVSLTAAIILAVPLGIVAAKRRRMGQVILGIVGVLYTIPALALLVFMIPLLGIGGPPALAALFLYSLLPIVRNTHAGLTDLPPPLMESAEALGLTARARLWRIEMPLSVRPVLAGVKTAAVINIGAATLGALIGAGGYGQPILTGIRLDDVGLILEGAVPAAAMALVAQAIFELAERLLLPRGLRLSESKQGVQI